MKLSRRQLLASTTAGLTALSGCITSLPQTPGKPSDEQIAANNLHRHTIELAGTQYKIEIPRTGSQERQGMKLAQALHNDGMSVTTSDIWSSSSGGSRWNLWAYGDLSEQDVQSYISQYNVDAEVITDNGAQSGTHILSDSPFETPKRWFGKGGEFGHRLEIWKALPEQLHPFQTIELSHTPNTVTFWQNPDLNLGNYMQTLLGSRGHIHLRADGLSPSELDAKDESPYDTGTLRAGRLVEPRLDNNYGEYFRDPNEFNIIELSPEDESSTQTWNTDWEPDWKEAHSQIRITCRILGTGLPSLIEWYQEHFDELPTTITVCIDDEWVASEQLSSLVENPAEPDTYGNGDHNTVLPRMHANTAAIIATHMAAPYDINLPAKLTIDGVS